MKPSVPGPIAAEMIAAHGKMPKMRSVGEMVNAPEMTDCPEMTRDVR
jgi:hypothetical protein